MAVNFHEGEELSEAYARFRPTYPQKLFDTIIEYHSQSVARSGSERGLTTAIIGCGTGQATSSLANYFQNVTGVDVSPTQISVARREFPDISFRVGKGEDLSFLPDNSVDLVTVATAIHWMDRNLVYSEVKRVLKPGGTRAVFMNRIPTLTHTEADLVFRKVWRETLWNYLGIEKVIHIETDYMDIEFPFLERQRVEGTMIKKSITVDQLIGLVSSYASWKAFLKMNEGSDLLERTKASLNAILDKEEKTPAALVEIQQTYVLLLGRNN